MVGGSFTITDTAKSACMRDPLRIEVVMAEKAPLSQTKSGESAGCKTTPENDHHEGDRPSPRTQPSSTTKVQEKEEAEKEDLERLAVAEILKETKRGKVRAEQIGAMGWQKCSLPKANKRFLNSVVASNLASNKRIKLNTSTTGTSRKPTKSIEQKSRRK